MGRKRISKRKDDRFEVKVTLGNGKRQSVYGETEAEAKRKAKELKAESLICDLTDITKLTVQDYMNYWLKDEKLGDIKPASYDRLVQICTYQIYPYIGQIRIAALKKEDITDMLEKVKEKWSYSTLKKVYNTLRSCLESAVEDNKITKNPMRKIKPPKEIGIAVQRKEVRPYTKEEINAIVAECTRQYSNGKYIYRYGYAFILMMNTGIRLGEALYLSWKDVSFENKTIFIHGNVMEYKNREKDGTHYVIKEQETPKTQKSKRYVNLNDNAVEALMKLKEIIGDEKYVIATENHNIVSPHNMHRTFSSILKKCQITDANDIIHALRHTFATMLIQKGTDIKLVSELLGHSDVTTTMKIYYHTIMEQKAIAVQKLDNLY